MTAAGRELVADTMDWLALAGVEGADMVTVASDDVVMVHLEERAGLPSPAARLRRIAAAAGGARPVEPGPVCALGPGAWGRLLRLYMPVPGVIAIAWGFERVAAPVGLAA
ncbi:hypothetical protein BBK14_02000 [Parafrankia soli]|uniref:Uncharacterized protein n=1 Tax=Parafrankia soli TaxID=2599596 RepID=A0A1S1RPB8_9ACTN|nr:hypothetical protein [Parafrankia soli]OHV46644.1 hypothetical protein BBK14_02000 [Parafrankia soli]